MKALENIIYGVIAIPIIIVGLILIIFWIEEAKNDN